MLRTLNILIVCLVASVAALAQTSGRYESYFNEAAMRERVKRLSADDMEGRGPGTDGGKRAAQYIADQLKAAGAKPGNGQSYFQNVRLVGVKADPATRLVATITGGPTNMYFNFGDDFVATTGAQASEVSVNSEVVFVGYGIDAPLYNWNDYKGDPARYRGKILMILVNDPPATSEEPDLFGGRALTYFGRWTYKYEEAARKGAAGVILVHTNESAGYGWNVVRTSNGNWRYEIARGPADKSPFLKFRSWMTNKSAVKVAGLGHFDLEELKLRAKKRDFQPVDLGVSVSLGLKSEMKTFDSPNVVGMIEGKDKKLKNEYVVFSGHWDHLGIGEADSSGDKIYNGAYDNASGVAAILGIAEAIGKLPPADRPKRSTLFLFPTGEEQGLLGAEYFSLNPVVPLARIAGNVNIDGVNFFGRTKNFAALGGERSSIGDLVADVARERGLRLDGDRAPEQGFFFRSDHFPFAKAGVPAISLRHGDDFVTPLEGEPLNFFRNYTAKYYHQPSDQYYEWWNSGAMVQNAEIGLAIALKIANSPVMPRYKDSDEFSAADKQRSK